MSPETLIPPTAAPARAAGPPEPLPAGGLAAHLDPRRLWRGRADDPAWVRPALLAVLALAAFLCLWDLTISGYSNTYYAAAAKSGSESWKAWFFGSLDPGSFITVDKPPLSLWLMGLSGRVLGFSSLSLLLPQALCSVAAVGALFATVRRLFGPAAGIAAATAFALTPITVAVARVNNPDALLVLLMVAAAYLLVRALQSGATKWLVWCGVLVGLAFMTKMLQGWMVLPALTAAYLLAGPPALWTRVRQLALAGAAMAAVSAAWPLAVSLWPGAKPYIGGSTDGSVWDLILGYNGLGRIFGEGEGGGAGAGFGGQAGLGRLFNDQVAGQVAWLLPLAGVGLVAGLWLSRRAARTDLARAGYVLFGVWALVHALVFSTQKGIFHPYYVSALAPAVAALAGVGAVLLWQQARRSWVAWGALAATVAGTAWLAVTILLRTPDFHPWLQTAVPVAAVLGVVASLGLRVDAARRLLPLAAVCGAFALLGGPASYAFDSVGHALNGNNVLAGPAVSSMGGGPGGAGAPGGAPTAGARPAGGPPSGGGMPTAGGMGGGGLDSTTIAWLQAHQGSATYLVAATGSQATASIILATGQPVVTIGGFNGQDPAPTVAQLAQLVADGRLKYVLVGGSGGGPGGRGGSTSSALTAWITAHGKAVTAVTPSSGTLYALTA